MNWEQQTHPEPTVTTHLTPWLIKGGGIRLWGLQGLPFAQALDAYWCTSVCDRLVTACCEARTSTSTQTGADRQPL